MYVPPNLLFELAFGNNWTDAHEDFDAAVEKVTVIASKTLNNQGHVWIAEAGQSDFSAALVKGLQKELSGLDLSKSIHLVQHSNWNEEVTSPESLKFVKENTDYKKIPDGNALDNGTPGLRSPGFKDWNERMTNPQLSKVWQLAVDLGNQYNGKEGRYNNEAVEAGGLDFSDFSEVWWILKLPEIKDVKGFFDRYSL